MCGGWVLFVDAMTRVVSGLSLSGNFTKGVHMETTRINEQDYTDLPTMLMALEISDKKWQVLFRRAGSTRERRKALLAWDLVELKVQIEAAKAKLGLPADARVMSCYE